MSERQAANEVRLFGLSDYFVHRQLSHAAVRSDSGQLLINGNDIREFDRAELQQRFAVVFRTMCGMR